MKSIALFCLLPAIAFAQQFEEPPVLRASEILRPEYAAGVREPVPTYGGRNGYMIDSEFGVFEADGNAMLMRRVREITAIRRLREVSRTEEYKSALVAAAKSPIGAAKGLIQHPVSTITGVPKGIWKFMNRAGEGIKERAQGRERSEYEDSGAVQLIGFSKAKRDVALDLGVDPYSSNEAFQRELNGIAWAAYAGKATFSLATMPVGGGAGLALTATGVSNTFEQTLRDQSPGDLRLGSLKRLLAMGATREVANTFLNHAAFSPSVQTALVLHLESLEGVKNRASFVRLAAQGSNFEGDALFFCETSRILAQLHAGGRRIARLDVLDELPVAVGADGSLIVALEWDYAAWTPQAARFVARVKAAKAGGRQPAAIVAALSGDASPMVQERLKAEGILLATRLAPGPLR